MFARDARSSTNGIIFARNIRSFQVFHTRDFQSGYNTVPYRVNGFLTEIIQHNYTKINNSLSLNRRELVRHAKNDPSNAEQQPKKKSYLSVARHSFMLVSAACDDSSVRSKFSVWDSTEWRLLDRSHDSWTMSRTPLEDDDDDSPMSSMDFGERWIA